MRDAVQEVVRHLPPSGSSLRLIVVGDFANIHELTLLRPDLRIARLCPKPPMQPVLNKKINARIAVLRTETAQWSFATSSVDAVLSQGVHTFVERDLFLREALRVLRPGGRLILLDQGLVGKGRFFGRRENYSNLTSEVAARKLESAGFTRVLGERIASGRLVLSRGEKPYSVSGQQATRQLMAEKLAVAIFPFVFLLIRQIPNRPIWALSPGTPIRWDAVSVLDATEANSPIALAFSSLPKAVAFMQPAVTANVLVGVTRIAKFERAVAAQWTFPILLNPVFEELHREERYTLPGPWLPIDPKSAVTGDE